jgi:hypothetical protein
VSRPDLARPDLHCRPVRGSQLECGIREHRDAEKAARAAAEHDVATVRRDYERRLAEADTELTALRAQVQAEAMQR